MILSMYNLWYIYYKIVCIYRMIMRIQLDATQPNMGMQGDIFTMMGIQEMCQNNDTNIFRIAD